MGRLNNAEVTAFFVKHNLKTLAVLDGGTSPKPEGLVEFVDQIGCGESHFANRHLDSPNELGYIPSRDIAYLFKK